MNYTDLTNYLTLNSRFFRGIIGLATIVTVLTGVLWNPAANFILTTASIYLVMTAIMGQEINSLVRGLGGIAAIAAVVSGLVTTPLVIFALATMSVYLTITAILAQDESEEEIARSEQAFESTVFDWVKPESQLTNENGNDHKHAA